LRGTVARPQYSRHPDKPRRPGQPLGLGHQVMRPFRRGDLHVLTAPVHPKRDPAQLVDPHRDDRPPRRDLGDDLRDSHGFAGSSHPTRLPDVEPVYGTVIQLARLVWRAQGLKFTVTGVENLPRTGGAVVAINHTSYFDFTFAGLPAYQQHLGRKVRFMAKKEVFDSKVTGPIMRSLRHIEVDRDSGADSFEQACRALKNGELVGVYPEATISRSFEIKEFKSGAARMAIAADVPIVPHIVWGAQRIWTKGHPRKMWRPKVPISVAVGEPIMPTLPPTELTALLHSRMQHLLERVQDAYGPHPPGEFWVPHRLGGGAPSLAEANQMDADEAAEKAARRAQRADPSGSPG
jgi:1-acyl-sn-glycerol-3-phosphate acyltransferase